MITSAKFLDPILRISEKKNKENSFFFHMAVVNTSRNSIDCGGHDDDDGGDDDGVGGDGDCVSMSHARMIISDWRCLLCNAGCSGA